jgi:two-component system response regulator NreC
MKRSNVVLADDHAVLRAGLQVLINAQPDMVVVAEAGTGPDAVKRVQETNAELLCLDLSMPGWGGAATIERVRNSSPNTRILILTMHDDPAYLRSAMTAGADGYMLKTTPHTSLISAMRSVIAGERVIDSPLLGYLDDKSGPQSPHEQTPSLSRRERNVLELLARGHTHQEIADKLFLSVKTVETYRARIKEKTGLKSRADFVRYGLEAGFLNNPNDVDVNEP